MELSSWHGRLHPGTGAMALSYSANYAWHSEDKLPGSHPPLRCYMRHATKMLVALAFSCDCRIR